MRIVWSNRALADVLAIADYYYSIDPDVADDMLDRVGRAAAPLAMNPHLGPIADDDTRKWRVPGTPDLLFYDVAADAIEIVTVRHAWSDWRRR